MDNAQLLEFQEYLVNTCQYVSETLKVKQPKVNYNLMQIHDFKINESQFH